MKTVILLSHGSRSKNSNTLTEKVAEAVSKRLNLRTVIANLQLSPPYLEEVIQKEYEAGIRSFIIHPFFLHEGIHVEEDIPLEVKKMSDRYRDAQFMLTEVTGKSGFIIDAVIEILKKGGCQ